MSSKSNDCEITAAGDGNENVETSPGQEGEKSELLSKIEAWQTDQDFDDDLGDFKLPEMNWEGLEAKLKEAALEENMKQVRNCDFNWTDGFQL